MITDYDPYKFNDILDYDSMRSDYGIGNKRVPGDYGYESFEEINVTSLEDDINLNGWYVPSTHQSAVSRRCIVLVHGRTSNRLKTMKYLELIKDEGLDTLYNVCIPDLRNSGKSDPGKTYMGYKFGEDLIAYLLYLHHKKKQDTFLLYGFSQGVMAILNAIGRSELSDSLSTNNMVIEKLIFDSSLSNVYQTLHQNGQKMGLPKFYLNIVLQDFSNQINGFGPQLRLSVLWKEVNIPTLILHSKDDQTTDYNILVGELALMDTNNIHLETYERVDHVMIYQDSVYHLPYTKLVGEFIRK